MGDSAAELPLGATYPGTAFPSVPTGFRPAFQAGEFGAASLPGHTTPHTARGTARNVNSEAERRVFPEVQAPAATPETLRPWKHCRQNTGRPWVGRKGTVVSRPHC